MSTITPIPTSEEALADVTAGNGAVTVLEAIEIGAGHQLCKITLERYDWRDADGNAEAPEFGVAFDRVNRQLDWPEIPPESIDDAIAALIRLKRAWNPEASRVQSLPPFDVKQDGGAYFSDAPMVALEEHEGSHVGLHVQAFRCGDSEGIDRFVGIVPNGPRDATDNPAYFTPEAALQLADDIRDTALALVADAEVAA